MPLVLLEVAHYSTETCPEVYFRKIGIFQPLGLKICFFPVVDLSKRAEKIYTVFLSQASSSNSFRGMIKRIILAEFGNHPAPYFSSFSQAPIQPYLWTIQVTGFGIKMLHRYFSALLEMSTTRKTKMHISGPCCQWTNFFENIPPDTFLWLLNDYS